MNIADLIMALQRGGDPNGAILASAQAEGDTPSNGPPGISQALASLVTGAGAPSIPEPRPRPTDAPALQAAAAPSGAPTPLTNPIPADQAPRIMQSPPDLSNMYLQLMKDNRNAALLDSGASLVAAGFSKYPETRAALIKNASGAHGQTGITSQDIVNLQGLQQKAQELQIRQAAKAGLMKRYNLDRDTLDYLDASGKLDEVVKHKNTQNLTLVTNADGSTAFHDPISGAKVVDVSAPKTEEGQWVEGPNGPELRSKKDGSLMGGGSLGLKPSDDERALAAINAQRKAKGEPELSTEDFLKTVKREAPNATDRAKFEEVNRGRVAKGEAPISYEDFIKTVQRDQPQEPNATQKARLDQINAERTKLGQKPMMMEELIKLEHGGVNINVSPDGTAFPAPAQGQDYIRTPEGKVKVFEDGKPKLYSIEGGKTEQDMAIKTREEKEHLEKQHKEKVQNAFAASNVGSAVDEAYNLAGRFGASGLGSKIVRGVPIGGMSWDTLDAKLNTINANTAFQTLQQMRASSPTGGALGQVSDFENRLLSSTISDLRAYQDTAELRRGLIRVKAAMHVLAEDSFKDGDAGRFQEALTKKIDEFTKSAINKDPGSKYKIKEIIR